MALTLDDVRRIAHLARIAVDDHEAQTVLDELTGIFRLIEQMQAVDTAGDQPMAHAQEMMTPLREDAVTEADHHGLYQSLAPQVERDMYLVPRVIE